VSPSEKEHEQQALSLLPLELHPVVEEEQEETEEVEYLGKRGSIPSY
jgi:hypothetical protein